MIGTEPNHGVLARGTGPETAYTECPTQLGGIPLDAGWLGLYTDGMGPWARVTVVDLPPVAGLTMARDPAEQALRHDKVLRKV